MDYTTLATPEVVTKTAEALNAKGYSAVVANTGAEALAKIKELIPQGASVMNGSSQSLAQIGFVDLLKSGTHGWNNLHEAIVKEKDEAIKADLRKQALLSDYYLGSVHALVENGEFIVASNSGSQLPHIVYSSPQLIFVVGTQKIVPTLDDALKRLETHVIPLEDERMHQASGTGTALSKLLVFKGESSNSQRSITVILVNEHLGF